MVLSFTQAQLCDTHVATYRAMVARYPTKTSPLSNEFCVRSLQVSRDMKSIAAGPLRQARLHASLGKGFGVGLGQRGGFRNVYLLQKVLQLSGLLPLEVPKMCRKQGEGDHQSEIPENPETLESGVVPASQTEESEVHEFFGKLSGISSGTSF